MYLVERLDKSQRIYPRVVFMTIFVLHPEAFPIIAAIYVTGLWKTDRNVTLGLFHFIGPANAYTHTLHIHTAIIRLG